MGLHLCKQRTLKMLEVEDACAKPSPRSTETGRPAPACSGAVCTRVAQNHPPAAHPITEAGQPTGPTERRPAGDTQGPCGCRFSVVDPGPTGHHQPRERPTSESKYSSSWVRTALARAGSRRTVSRTTVSLAAPPLPLRTLHAGLSVPRRAVRPWGPGPGAGAAV